MLKKPILYMHPVSPPSRAVLMTAAALGIELEQKSIDLLSFEHMKPEFIKVIALETKRVKIIISVQFFDFIPIFFLIPTAESPAHRSIAR